MTCTAEKEESIRLRRKERACQARQTAAVSIKIEITRSENNCSYQQRRKTSRHKNKQEIYYEKFSLLLLCFEDNFWSSHCLALLLLLLLLLPKLISFLRDSSGQLFVFKTEASAPSSVLICLFPFLSLFWWLIRKIRKNIKNAWNNNDDWVG